MKLKKYFFVIVLLVFALLIVGCKEDSKKSDDVNKDPENPVVTDPEPTDPGTTEPTDPGTTEPSVNFDEVVSYALEFSKDEVFDKVNWPTSYKGATLVWKSQDEDILDNDGYVYSEDDSSVDVKCTISLNGQTKTETFNVKVCGTNMYLAVQWFDKQIPMTISRTLDNIKLTNPSLPGFSVTWTSSNQEVFSNSGVYKAPFVSEEIVITYIVKDPNNKTKTVEKKVSVLGLTADQKATIISEYLNTQVDMDKTVSSDLALPSEYKGANIKWSSSRPEVISDSGKFTNVGLDINVTLTAIVYLSDGQVSVDFRLITEGATFTDMWDAVDAVLNMITLDEIKTQKYQLIGGTNYDTFNYGYLPFLTNERATIISAISTNSAVRTNVDMTGDVEYIICHDTQNTGINANSQAHSNLLNSDYSSASWHFSVDDTQIHNNIPCTPSYVERAKHAGSGVAGVWNDNNARAFNSNTIGIESCVFPSIDYTKCMRLYAKLVAGLLIDFKLDRSRVKQHYFVYGKDCPATMRHANRWDEFLSLIDIEYFAMKYLKDVTFTWTSLSPLMDNTGKITATNGNAATINYKVDVKYNGVTKTFNYSTNLLRQSW